jgi:hypothetical protein
VKISCCSCSCHILAQNLKVKAPMLPHVRFDPHDLALRQASQDRKSARKNKHLRGAAGEHRDLCDISAHVVGAVVRSFAADLQTRKYTCSCGITMESDRGRAMSRSAPVVELWLDPAAKLSGCSTKSKRNLVLLVFPTAWPLNKRENI